MIRRMANRHFRKLILCRECWHWNQISTHNGRCLKLIILTAPTHFCGYAKHN